MEDIISNNPTLGAALNVNEAADLIAKQLDDTNSNDSEQEQSDEFVVDEEPSLDSDEAETVDETDTETDEVEEDGESNEDGNGDEISEETIIDVNGEKITLAELKNGYYRFSDYTKKSQELAEKRRYYDENQRDINELRTGALEALEGLKRELSANFQAMEAPDWNWLANNDPSEFIRLQHEWSQKEAVVKQLMEAENDLRNKKIAYEQEQHQAALQESANRFYGKYPEYKDTEKATELFSDITKYLIDNGFSKEEINSVADYRIIEILRENIMYKKQLSKTPTAVAKIEKKPAISANKPSNKRTSNQLDYDKFRQRPNVENAAALIRNLL